tara:strand:+ start:193 stop:393 length:201 start_codon:yes stop_codon:yes gene_type:complete
MKSTNHNKIREEPVSVFNEEKTFVIAKRLEDENYAAASNRLKHLHLLPLLAINRTELSSDYFKLLY